MAEIEKKTKRPARTDLREVLNAIRYLVYWWFRRFVRRFLFQTTIEIIKRSIPRGASKSFHAAGSSSAPSDG
jgi:hypothetical protein